MKHFLTFLFSSILVFPGIVDSIENTLPQIKNDSLKQTKLIGLAFTVVSEDPIRAEKFALQGLRINDSTKFPIIYIDLQTARYIALFEQKKYEKAFNGLFALIEFAKGIKEIDGVKGIEANLSAMLMNLGEFEEPLNIYKAQIVDDTIPRSLAFNYINIMICSYYLDQLDSVLVYSDLLNKLDLRNNVLFEVFTSQLEFLALTYAKLGRLDSAEKYIKKLADTSEFYGLSEKILEAKFLNAGLSIKRNDTTRVLETLNEVRDVAMNYNLSSLLLRYYQSKSNYYEVLNLSDSVLKYKNLEYRLKDSLERTKYKIKLKTIENDYQKSNLKNELAEFKYSFIISITTGVLILFVCIWLFMRIYKKKKHNEFLEQILSKTNENILSLDNKVKVKDNDIKSLAEKVIKSNKKIAQLEKELQEQKEKPELTKQQEIIDFKTELNLSNLNEELYNRLTTISSGFIKSLSEKTKDLTPTEKRVCALINSGFSTKEIASMMYLSHRTIDNHRNSIRRKLKLKPDLKLNAYLESM